MRRFTIFSIDNSRRSYTDAMRGHLRERGWTELYTRCINGQRDNDLEVEIARRGVEINPNGPLTRGEMGVWMTFLNGIENAPVVHFEDDAILGSTFDEYFDQAVKELPDDFDFFTLFIPRDSDHMYNSEAHHVGAERICKAYHKYGGVSMYISEQGAIKIKSLIERDGITDQWDDQLYNYASRGELKGYSSKPSLPDIVYITGTEPSTVHSTKEFIHAR